MGNHFTAEVKLEHDVYFPGNVVRGTATIKIDKPTPCLAARITCRGVERAICVTEGTSHIHQDTVIFKETLTLFGHSTHDHDESTIEVPPGTYTYPFTFQLPMKLPNSVHFTNWTSGGAEIKYSVTAYVKISKERFDEGHADFTVITPVNFRDVIASPPSVTEDLVHLSAHLAKQGTCGVRVHINRSIFAPGETIEGKVTIDNSAGHIAIGNIPISLIAVCESGVDKEVADTWYNLGGGATADPVIRTKIPCNVGPGENQTMPLRLQLPHVIQCASYPSKGTHINLRHDVVMEVAGKRIDLPVYVAHCADPKNRFEFMPPQQLAYRKGEAVEYRYSVPETYGATTCYHLAPPATLAPQPAPVASTIQAVGNGPITA